MKKPNNKGWRTRLQKPYNAPKSCQKHVRFSKPLKPSTLDVQRLLGRFMPKVNEQDRVEKIQAIADELSRIAQLNNDHVWGWRYVQSCYTGTIVPSQKFINAVVLYSEKYNPLKKQWSYFVRNHSLISIFERLMMSKAIAQYLKSKGYKSVTYSKYMQVKRKRLENKLCADVLLE